MKETASMCILNSEKAKLINLVVYIPSSGRIQYFALREEIRLFSENSPPVDLGGLQHILRLLETLTQHHFDIFEAPIEKAGSISYVRRDCLPRLKPKKKRSLISI